MPAFTIETTYHLPVFRHQTYEAETLAQACRLAIEDDDWSREQRDYESAGETYVSGIWPGVDAAYHGAALPVPSHFGEGVTRKADHFEILLGLLKLLVQDRDLDVQERSYWIPRADAAIAKGEAILAGARDPDDRESGRQRTGWSSTRPDLLLHLCGRPCGPSTLDWRSG